jgi:hypothetical protein
MKAWMDMMWDMKSPEFIVTTLWWLGVAYVCWQLNKEVDMWRMKRVQNIHQKRARF